MKSRIDSALAIVAELSSIDPLVYMALGYAWGKAKHTLLLIREGEMLPFDTHGLDCLTYNPNKIKKLDETLRGQFSQLISIGHR